MAESHEYLTLLHMQHQLKIGIKMNIVELADTLLSEGLINVYCYEEVSRSRSLFTTTEKVEVLIRTLMLRVKASKESYHRILDILARSRFYGDLVKMLNTEYARLEGGKEGPTPDLLEPSRQSTVWKQQFTMRDVHIIQYTDRKTSPTKELRILEDLAPYWKEVADLLGIPPRDTRAIENPGSGRSNLHCIKEVLKTWLQGIKSSHYAATWQGMYNLLMDCLHGRTARDLNEAIESECSSLHGNSHNASPECMVPKVSPQQLSPQSPSASSSSSAKQFSSIIQRSMWWLVPALQHSIDSVADHCFSNDLISSDTYHDILQSDSNARKSRVLLMNVISTISVNSEALHQFLHVLNTIGGCDQAVEELERQIT